MSPDDPATRRLLRERADTRQATEHEKSVQLARRDESRAQLLRAVERLVPEALQSLGAAGWPGGRLVTIVEREGFARFFTGGKTREIAAWRVGSVPHDRGAEGLFLLADGRWMLAHQGRPVSFGQVLDHVGDWASKRMYKRDTPQDVVADLSALARGDFDAWVSSRSV